jgi:SAM-dependent methyltransferase
MLATTEIDSLATEMAEHLTGNEKEFFRRVWSTDPSVYETRLKAIGFADLDNVLDAGCGFGQWAVALSRLNRKVHATDYSESRVVLLKKMAQSLNTSNLTCSVESIERSDAADNTFDAIFCYSVIFLSDYRKAITEFARILKPGGKVYICSNGLGWYLYNIVSGHNEATDFDPQRMGIDAIENTFNFLQTGNITAGQQLVIAGHRMKEELEKNALSVEALTGEGVYSVNSNIQPVSFFKSEYLGAEGVYEIVARKAVR